MDLLFLFVVLFGIAFALLCFLYFWELPQHCKERADLFDQLQVQVDENAHLQLSYAHAQAEVRALQVSAASIRKIAHPSPLVQEDLLLVDDPDDDGVVYAFSEPEMTAARKRHDLVFT